MKEGLLTIKTAAAASLAWMAADLARAASARASACRGDGPCAGGVGAGIGLPWRRFRPGQ